MKNTHGSLAVRVRLLLVTMLLVVFGTFPVYAENGNEVETEAETEVSTEVPDPSQLEVVLSQDTYTYSAQACEPSVTLMDGEEDVTEQYIYTVSYTDNLNAGTASATVEISGYLMDGMETNFEEPVVLTKEFSIEAKTLTSSDVSLSYKYATYNGEKKTPVVTVKDGETVLTEGIDYILAYRSNIQPGTAYVTVTGQGNYCGEVEKTFTIRAIKLLSADVKLSFTRCYYNGSYKKPVVTVTHEDKKLTKGTSYTVSYKNNKNAGTATVTVTGMGHYRGEVIKTFTINPLELRSSGVKLSKTSYAYTGSARNPGVTVLRTVDGTQLTLKKGTDYTVSYQDSSYKIGKHTVTVKGKGNYTGTIKKTYSVVPEAATGVTVAEQKQTSIRFSCTPAKDSDCKYQFVLYKYVSDQNWEKVSSRLTSNPYYRFSDLATGTSYKCAVRYYKSVNDVTYHGEFSNYRRSCTVPVKPVISYASKTGSTTMKVTWAAVSGGATGYEVQYSRNSDFSNASSKKVTGVTTTSASISGLSDATYYARVRAYKTSDGNTVYSSWSSSVSTYFSNVYASYTTYYSEANYNRTTNLRLACKAINGTIVQNGSVFSFNATVGERTAAKGYKEAIIYEGGQEVGGIGGGICQVATTLFNACLRANFGIVERHQHSMTVHYVPYGYDAAVAWGSKNFQFRNNSGYPIKIEASVSGGVLTFKFRTNTYAKPPAVTTKVTVSSDKVYTLKRYVNGVCNYTTTSKYSDL